MLNSEKMKFLKILHGGLKNFDTPNYIEYFKEYLKQKLLSKKKILFFLIDEHYTLSIGHIYRSILE